MREVFMSLFLCCNLGECKNGVSGYAGHKMEPQVLQFLLLIYLFNKSSLISLKPFIFFFSNSWKSLIGILSAYEQGRNDISFDAHLTALDSFFLIFSMKIGVIEFSSSWINFTFYQEIISFLSDVKYFPVELFVVFPYDYLNLFSRSGCTLFSFLILSISV